MRTGLGLGQHDLSDTLVVFADLVQRAGEFYSRSTTDSGKTWLWRPATDLTLLPDGTPSIMPPPTWQSTQATLAATLDLWRPFDDVLAWNNSQGRSSASDVQPPYSRGDTLVLLWKGSGEVWLTGDVNATLKAVSSTHPRQNSTRPATPAEANGYHRAVVEVRTTGAWAGLQLRIVRSEAAAPVSSLHVVPASLERAFWAEHPARLFRPAALELLRAAAPDTVRLADWAGRYVSWPGREALRSNDFSSDRSLPAHPTQGREDLGVSLEDSLRLCRAVNASCWLAAPERPSASYLEAYARWLARHALADDAWAASRRGADGAEPALLYVEWGRGTGYTQPQAAGLAALATALEGAAAAEEDSSSRPRGSLRARLRLVLLSSRAEYLPHLLALHRPTGVLPSVDVVALPASVGDHSPTLAPWSRPDAPVASLLARFDPPAIHAALRTAALEAEVAWNRAVANAQSWNVTRTGPRLPRAAAAGSPQGDRGFEVVAYDAGISLRAAPFGARSDLWAAEQSGNATAVGLLSARAAAEQAWEDRLIEAQRNASGDAAAEHVLLDHFHRLERSGFAAVVAGPLVRHAQRAFGPAARGITLRESGSVGLAEPLPPRPRGDGEEHAAPSADDAIAASPKLRALVRYGATGARSRLAFTAAGSGDVSDGGAACAAPASCPGGCVWGTCWEGRCRCFEGASGPACATLGPRPCHRAPHLGVNVGGVADYSTQRMYVDSGRASRPFISQCLHYCDVWDDGRSLRLAPSGELASLGPLQAVGTMMLRSLGGHYEQGTYVILHDGDGVVVPTMDDVVAVRRTAPGRLEVDLRPFTGLNNGLFLRVERSNPLDPVRRVRVVPARHEASFAAFPFHPRFLRRLGASFSSIRAMDLLRTNANEQSEWSQRVTSANRTYTVEGVPLEDVVLLANTLALDLWLNVPYRASDDFVASMARLVRDTLRPDVNVTVELANEVWSSLFPAGQHARSEGVRLGLDRLSTLATGSDEAAFCWYGRRSREVFAAWEREWGPSRRGRLTFTVAAQAANPDVARRILACNGTGAAVDSLAIAPYFSGSSWRGQPLGVVMNTTLPLEVGRQLNLTRDHAVLARAHGVRLDVYEGGQGMVGTDDDSTALQIAANRHAGMRPLYGRYLAGLLREGVSRAMLFSFIGRPSEHGSWGHWEALDSPDGPKALGLKDHVEATGTCPAPAPAPGCPAAPAPAQVPTVIVRAHPDGDVEPGTSTEASSWSAAATSSSSAPASRPSGAASVCAASGDCVSPRLGASPPACSCDFGWSGPNCTARDPVVFSSCSYQCSGHGRCLLHRIEQGFRHFHRGFCDEGYGGPRCTARKCLNKCSFNGRCGDDLRCRCFDGFRGADCSADCGCNGHGTCREGDGDTCRCDAGYRFEAGKGCVPVCDCPDKARQRCLRPGVCSLPPGQCVSGIEVGGRCECWAGFRGRRCDVRARPGLDTRLESLGEFNPVGINVGGIADWSTEWVFADLFKTARGWISQHHPDYRPSSVFRWDTDTPQNLTADGYPRSLPLGFTVSTLMARSVRRRLPDGIYTVTYRGSGRFLFGMDASVVSERKGRIEVRVVLSLVRDNGIFLQLLETDPADPVRDVRVAMPGMADRVADGAVFHPVFLRFLRQFGSARFMDLQHTNDATGQVEWARDRPRETAASWGAGWKGKVPGGDAGVPLSLLLDLANQAGTDPWLCVPHAASDAYVRAFARLVRDRLAGHLVAYVARSNERWNPLFPAARHDEERAAAMGLPTSHAYHGVRSERIFDIFEEEFGAAERRRRLVLVVDTQSVSTWVTSSIFAGSATLAAKADALGVTAYVDCGGLGASSRAVATAGMSVGAILDACEAELPAMDRQWRDQVDVLRRIVPAEHWKSGNRTAAEQRSLLSTSPLPLVTYEAGPALVESAAIARGYETPGLTDKLIAATRHPRMEVVYRRYLDAFGRLGLAGGRRASMPYFHFSSVGLPSKYGSWGLIESSAMPVDASPKGRALFGYARSVVADLTRAGCTDPAASNHDPRARFSNGSCAYPPVTVSSEAGGSVGIASADTPVVLSFPPSALLADTPISVAAVAAIPGAKPVFASAQGGGDGGASSSGAAASGGAPSRAFVGPTLRFGPAGTTFGRPVRVCLTINMTTVAAFGWDAWSAPAADPGAGAAAPTEDDLLAAWNASSPSALAGQLRAAGDEDGAGQLGAEVEAVADVALYHSRNGSVWEAAEASSFNDTTGELCAELHHFTLVSGVRGNATELRSEEAAAREERTGAEPTPQPSSAPSSAPASPPGGQAAVPAGGAEEQLPAWLWGAVGAACGVLVIVVAVWAACCRGGGRGKVTGGPSAMQQGTAKAGRTTAPSAIESRSANRLRSA